MHCKMPTKLNTAQEKRDSSCGDFRCTFTSLEDQNFRYRIKSGRNVHLKDGKKVLKLSSTIFQCLLQTPLNQNCCWAEMKSVISAWTLGSWICYTESHQNWVWDFFVKYFTSTQSPNQEVQRQLLLPLASPLFYCHVGGRMEKELFKGCNH